MKDKLKNFFVNNRKKVIIGAAILAALVVAIIVVLLTGKGKKNDNAVTGNTTPVTYTLNVQTEGGMKLNGINAFVYDGTASDDLLAAGKTDENGQFAFTTEKEVSALGFVLQGLPEKGYELKDLYKVTEAKGEKKDQLYISISTKIEQLTDTANTSFALGSVIKDFTVTTPDGTEVTISKLLAEKDAVVLNFFYLACQPCKNEFPYLEEAYKLYGDNVAVVALTPVDKNDDEIKAFIEELGLTFYVAQCDSAWEQMMSINAYPTTVVIDRWGMISFIHEGSVTEAGVFDAIFEYFIQSDYVQQIVNHLDDIIYAEAEEGTEGNPIEILPDATEFDAQVGVNSEVYYEISKISNMIFTIEDADAYIIYEEETYSAVDGVVSVVISAPDTYTPARFVIGNSGSSDKTFKVVLGAVKGTMMNPYELVIGEVTTEIQAGNEQGVYHTFTAAESGVLTYIPVSVTDDVAFDVTLYNLNTYANRTLSADTNEDGTVSVEVNAEDVVQIIVSTLPDENNEYPAATVVGELSFVAGEVSTGTSGTEDDDFEDETTSTESVQVTYTITVTDTTGSAIKDATVIVGNSTVTTDAGGVATFTLTEGDYDVMVTATGYGVGSCSVSSTSTSVTIKLEKSTGTSGGVTYTVNTVNYKGEALSGVTVVFKSGTTAVATATTDSTGVATAQLASGSYDITLAYDGYGFEKSTAKVSATQTSVTLTMAEISTTYEEVYFDVSNAYALSSGTGARYVEVPATDSVNEGGNAFFLFTPGKSGKYKIELSDTSGLISYWGGSTSYVNDATYDVTHTNTSITLNVVEKGPTFVIGIKSTTGCIVTITRIGNATTEMAWTDYVATDAVSAYTAPSGTLTYVDITQATSKYTLVYNSTDGYYHLGSASGPVMLVHLGAGAPIIALSDVIGFTGSGGSNFGKYFYDASGNLIKKENYTSLLWTYMENMDSTKYVYPLTKDLEYILKNGGEYRGWWATSGYGNTIYTAVPSLNSEIAWMWACCYIAQ